MSGTGGGVSVREPLVARVRDAPARVWFRAGVVLMSWPLLCASAIAVGCQKQEQKHEKVAAEALSTSSKAAALTDRPAEPQRNAGYGEPIGARVEAGANTPGFEVAVASSGPAAAQLLPGVTSLLAKSFVDCAGLQRVAQSKPALSVAFTVSNGQARAETLEAPALPEAELGCLKRGLLGQTFAGVKAPEKFLVQFRLTS